MKRRKAVLRIGPICNAHPCAHISFLFFRDTL